MCKGAWVGLYPAGLSRNRRSCIWAGETEAWRHEALPYSPTGDHAYEILYRGFGLQLGNLLVVKVLNNFDRRARFQSKRGDGGLVRLPVVAYRVREFGHV